MRSWLTAAVVGIAGLTAGYLIGHGGGDTVASAVVGAVQAPGAMHGAAPAFTLDDVRRVVRQELDARAPSRPAVAALRNTSEPDSAQVAAAARASAVFEAALARRNWTQADSDALREDFVNMAPDQQAEWLRQFSVAVNQGRLVPETERSPF